MRRSRTPIVAAVLPLLAVAVLAVPGRARGQTGEVTPRSIRAFLEKKGLKETEAFRKLLRDATLELKSQNYHRAAELLVQAFRGFPEHPLPCMLLGLTFARMGFFEQASLYIRKGISVYPGIRDAGFDYKTYQPDEGELAQIVQSLEKKMNSPQAGSIMRNRCAFVAGAILFFSGKGDQARGRFGKVQEGSVEAPATAWLLKAFEKKKTARPVKKGGGNFEAGNKYFLAGRYREAAFAFGFAFLEDPENVVACFEMAHALFACGEYHKAARMIVLGVERYPGWAATPMNRRDFYAKTRKTDFDAQVDRLRLACEKAGSDPALWYLLGYNFYFSARKSRAQEAFRKVKVGGWIAESDYFLMHLGVTPVPPATPPKAAPPEKSKLETWLASLTTGKEAFKAGRYGEAVAAYRQALALRPEAPIVRFELARSLFAGQRFGEASKEVRAGLRALPASERHQIRWKSAYEDEKLFEKHLGALQDKLGLSTGPESLDLDFLFAFSLFYSGRFKEAAVAFEKIFVRNPQDAEAIYYFKLIDKLLKKK